MNPYTEHQPLLPALPVARGQLYLHDTEDMALKQKALLEEMTGDRFAVELVRGKYRVIRIDPSGKVVE